MVFWNLSVSSWIFWRIGFSFVMVLVLVVLCGWRVSSFIGQPRSQFPLLRRKEKASKTEKIVFG